VEGDLREAVWQMQHYPLIKTEAVLGMDPDLMLKATFITTETDVANLFFWLLNFAPFEQLQAQYVKSPKLPIQDIIVVAFNEWTCDDPFYNNVGAPQLALVDEKHNVIFNLGMRYFGERKKGTLTLAGLLESGLEWLLVMVASRNWISQPVKTLNIIISENAP
jgi:phosphoenolpyruvate carboxykinase (ATP)